MIRTRLHTSDTDLPIPAGLAELSSLSGAGASDRLTSEPDDFASTLWELIGAGSQKDSGKVSTNVPQPSSSSPTESPRTVTANTQAKPTANKAASPPSVTKDRGTSGVTYDSASDPYFPVSSRSTLWTYQSLSLEHGETQNANGLYAKDSSSNSGAGLAASESKAAVNTTPMQARSADSFASLPLTTARPLPPISVATTDAQVPAIPTEPTAPRADAGSYGKPLLGSPTAVKASGDLRESTSTGPSGRPDANNLDNSRLTQIGGRSNTGSKTSIVADGDAAGSQPGVAKSPSITSTSLDSAQLLVLQKSVTQGTTKRADAFLADAEPTHSTAPTPTNSPVPGKVASLEATATPIIDSAPTVSHKLAVGVQLFQGDVNYLSTQLSQTGTAINARDAQVSSSDALVGAPKVANRSQAGSGKNEVEVSAPTRFVSTPGTATVLRPAKAVQAGPDHVGWQPAVLSALIRTSPTSSIGPQNKTSDRELAPTSNDLAPSHASAADRPNTAAPAEYPQASATGLHRNQVLAGKPNQSSSAGTNPKPTELETNESSLPVQTAPTSNIGNATTGKSEQASQVETRNAPAVTDSVDLTTTPPVAEPTQVGRSSSIKVYGNTTDVTTETISTSAVGSEQKRFANANLPPTNNEPAHSASSSAVKVQISDIDVTDRGAFSPPSANSTAKDAAAVESADILSNESVSSNVSSDVTDKPATNSLIGIAGFSRISQPKPGVEQKQFAPSNLVSTNNERAHSAATSPAKVQTSGDTVPDQVAPGPLSASSTGILFDESVTANGSSEVADKPATDSSIEITGSSMVVRTPSENAGRSDSVGPETTLTGFVRDLTEVATGLDIAPAKIESAPLSAPAQGQSYGTQRATSTTKDSLRSPSTSYADARATAAGETPREQSSTDLHGSAARQATSSADENNRAETFASEDSSAPTAAGTTTAQDHTSTVAGVLNKSATPNLSIGATAAGTKNDVRLETSPTPPSAGTAPSALSFISGQTPTPDGNIHAPEGPLLKPTAESQPLRQVSESGQVIEVGRTANLTVQLAEGQTVRATVRQRDGSVDVKIVTSNSATAERVSGELDAMRQNFDSAGLQLGRSEVSYEQGGGRDRDGQQTQRESDPNPTSKEIFSLGEVVQ
jgi:hypothetical protein